MRLRILFALLCAAYILFVCVPAPMAQTVTGTLSGHVTDASGALIPRVTVIAKS